MKMLRALREWTQLLPFRNTFRIWNFILADTKHTSDTHIIHRQNGKTKCIFFSLLFSLFFRNCCLTRAQGRHQIASPLLWHLFYRAHVTPFGCLRSHLYSSCYFLRLSLKCKFINNLHFKPSLRAHEIIIIIMKQMHRHATENQTQPNRRIEEEKSRRSGGRGQKIVAHFASLLGLLCRFCRLVRVSANARAMKTEKFFGAGT